VSQDGWHWVADEAELAPGSLRGALVAGQRLCVGRFDTGWFAVSDTCPHAGGSLSEGMIDGRELICPLHAWGFDVETGTSPDDPSCVLSVYEIRVSDGAIEVRLPTRADRKGPDE
jgi:nitrite reductase/ring-hydroxylating ferredoxin subunit